MHQAGEQAPPPYAHFAHRQLDRKGGPTLALRDHFAPGADDALFAGVAITLQVAVMFLMVGRGHEQGNVFAQHFRRRIAEQAFSGGVEGIDNPALVDGDDGIDRGVHNRA